MLAPIGFVGSGFRTKLRNSISEHNACGTSNGINQGLTVAYPRKLGQLGRSSFFLSAMGRWKKA